MHSPGVLPPGLLPPQPAHWHLWLKGTGGLPGSRTLPEDTAREEDLILHLVGGATRNLHAVLVLLFHLISHIILLGNVTPIVDLEANPRVNWNVHLSQASLVILSPSGLCRERRGPYLGFALGVSIRISHGAPILHRQLVRADIFQ